MLKIHTYPDSLLRRQTRPVEHIDRELRSLIGDMFDTMYEDSGIGLAAPQVGETLRLCVVNVTGDADDELVLVNPVVVERSGEEVEGEEGCLSVPGVRADVLRPDQVKVRAFDENGRELELDADGLDARCLQHEIDHLEGRLFIDRLNDARRMLVNPQLKRLEREYAR